MRRVSLPKPTKIQSLIVVNRRKRLRLTVGSGGGGGVVLGIVH